jgi:ubiquinone/menaquinone biosynthesis C-methylase UbiE
MTTRDTRLDYYVIRGGEEGIRRLGILADVMWPTTRRVLERAGIREGMKCLDLGSGGGEVTMAIAQLVGSTGKVVGIDLDEVKSRLARHKASDRQVSNVEYRLADVTEWEEDSVYDLIYARFLLTHLRDPRLVVSRMLGALKPGGMAVVEDIDFAGHVCYPGCPAFDSYVSLYQEVVRLRGGDANIGPRLPCMLADAGFADLHIDLTQPVFMTGEGKSLAALTFRFIIDSLVADGLGAEANLKAELEELETYTNDPRTLLSLPRVFQVWGYRPA